MSAVFQFMLGKIKRLNDNQKAIVKSISFVHGEVLDLKNKNNTGSPNRAWRGAHTLKGDLTLEYRGAIADTRATFMLDEE